MGQGEGGVENLDTGDVVRVHIQSEGGRPSRRLANYRNMYALTI